MTLPSIAGIEKAIKKAMKDRHKGKELAIKACAVSYLAYLKIAGEIEKASPVIEEVSREKDVRYKPHPAFNMLKDATSTLLSCLKDLGLTSISEIQLIKAEPKKEAEEEEVDSMKEFLTALKEEADE